MKKYFLVFNDGVFEKVCLLNELSEDMQKHIQSQLFGIPDFINWGKLVLIEENAYIDYFSLETDLSIKQVESVLKQDFYVDTLALANIIGKVEKIKL
jgi:hypothetical protein